jgi:Polysaccharide lyase
VPVRSLLPLALTVVLAGVGGLATSASAAARKAAARKAPAPRACLTTPVARAVRGKRHQSKPAAKREPRRCQTPVHHRRKKAKDAKVPHRKRSARVSQRPATEAPVVNPVATRPAVSRPAVPSLVWNGDLSTGTMSQYGYVQQCSGSGPPKGVTVVTSPVHPGYAYSSKFTVSDQSVAANCPRLGSAGHPNANLQSPGLFAPGDNEYIGFSTYFPSSFPNNVCTPWVPLCWMQIMEIYGQPYGGIPPVAMYVIGNKLTLGDTGRPIWKSPRNIVKNTWEDVVLHVNFSTNPSVGYVELWLDGVQQTFTTGRTRYYQATLRSEVNWNGVDANRLYLDEYRGARPAMGTVTLYHSAAKVAATYARAAL